MESQVADYYAVLGLERTATPDEIRRAYRKLARQHHPDLHGGDSEAAERFKEINRAYEVLSDPEKRARYDRFGAGGVDGGAPGAGDFGFGGFGPFGDIFEAFFGAGGRATAERGPERGRDLRYDLEITLEEVLSGTEKTITVPRMERCDTCRGTGAKAGTQPQTCVACHGHGVVRTVRQTLFGTVAQESECYRCHGRGQIVTDPCGDCGGRGVQRKTRRLQVKVPPGAEERSRMRLAGEGDVGPMGGPAGDVYVFLHIKPHPRFRRHGRDLISEIEISFPRAALGGEVEVPTLGGVEKCHVPPGTQPDEAFTLRGKGLPELGRPGVRGDQHVVIHVRTPVHLNERQRRALQEFAEASGEDLSTAGKPKQEGGFFEWVRSLFNKDEAVREEQAETEGR